jgi:NADH-quinone oxidoreductase subunit N
MTLMPNASDFANLWLDLALAGLILLLIGVDALVTSPRRKRLVGYAATLGLVLLLALSFVWPPSGLAFFGAHESTSWALFGKRLLLAIGAVVCLGSVERLERVVPRRQAEYVILLLFSLLGSTLLVGATDLILLVICFELAGIPLFILAAYDKTELPGEAAQRTAEGAFKFFAVGVVSTPFSLFGLSLVVGFSGTTRIAELISAPNTPVMQLGMLLLLAGMGFKLGVVPFHMWMPDAYQAASTPFVAFVSAAPKLAALAALARVFLVGFADHAALWTQALVLLAALSLVFGNLWALAQRNTKRLLAYSSIGHVGYLLMGVATAEEFGLATLLFYLLAYAATNLGVFLVAEAVTLDTGEETLDEFAGLARRSPWLALSMLLFLLSLAGIPFVAGFWAKLYVFLAAWRAGFEWMVVLGALLAVLALFYYLQIARAMYMTPPTRDSALRTSPGLTLAIVACLAAVVGFGVLPGPALDEARAASASLLQTSAASKASLSERTH